MTSTPASPSSSSFENDKETEAKEGDSALVKSSFSSLSFLVALQLFSRLFTSILNQALFRLASPGVFGTAAIQFELILSTILFLSREGVRNVILRTNTGATSNTNDNAAAASSSKGDNAGAGSSNDDAMNLAFLPFYLGVPLALATSAGYVALASEEVRRQPYLVLAVGVYAVAALVELLSEPMHNMCVPLPFTLFHFSLFLSSLFILLLLPVEC